MAAAEEAGPVGFDFRPAHDFAAVDDGEMGGPDFRLRRRPSSPCREDGADLREILGLDEQLGKGRMRDIGGLRRQHQLGIGGELDLPRAGACIRDRDAADFGIILGRDEHLHCRRKGSVVACELGAILVKATWYSSGSAPLGWKPADHTSPLRTSLRKT